MTTSLLHLPWFKTKKINNLGHHNPYNIPLNNYEKEQKAGYRLNINDAINKRKIIIIICFNSRINQTSTHTRFLASTIQQIRHTVDN